MQVKSIEDVLGGSRVLDGRDGAVYADAGRGHVDEDVKRGGLC